MVSIVWQSGLAVIIIKFIRLILSIIIDVSILTITPKGPLLRNTTTLLQNTTTMEPDEEIDSILYIAREVSGGNPLCIPSVQIELKRSSSVQDPSSERQRGLSGEWLGWSSISSLEGKITHHRKLERGCAALRRCSNRCRRLFSCFQHFLNRMSFGLLQENVGYFSRTKLGLNRS